MKSWMAILLVMALIIFTLDNCYSTDDKPIGKCGDRQRNKLCLVCQDRSQIDYYYTECCIYDQTYYMCLDMLRH
uniref:Kappa-scoloptoxin(03)-Ssm1c n=1 Tax=Scolopendra mutilans TaxID=2836329 RepID=TX31C_SCOMU|nr:RecName: Full=Kappa-scoloptoxin(03)-Ssm1c; Short=Kappa-SLPTX(03)-Ssm1c; AltName: Full=Kappa-scoloptoxin-Ssm1c; Short=Kappa-SLPTX-Ssm1c; Flags: Precursor [Scolopendra mutilans]AFM55017.1 putative K+ channel inhibitor 8 [Scolopendra subspinipes]